LAYSIIIRLWFWHLDNAFLGIVGVGCKQSLRPLPGVRIEKSEEVKSSMASQLRLKLSRGLALQDIKFIVFMEKWFPLPIKR
jgi:hypothetical protein